MIKNIYTILFFNACCISAYSQVGIDTNTPLTTLQINEKRFSDNTNDSSKADGILIPRLTKAELAIKSNTTYQASELESVLVFVTEISENITGPSTSQVIHVNAPGFYYLNSQNIWEPLTGIGVDSTDDAWVNNPSQNRVELGYTSSGENRANGSEVVITDQGNLGINVINPTKRLDINAASNSNTTDFIKISNLAYPPTNTVTKTLQIDDDGYISRRSDENIEGKIVRLPLQLQSNIGSQSTRIITVEYNPNLSPNLTPNLINLIPGFNRESNSEFSLPAGLYKYEVRIIGYFSKEDQKNSISLTTYVNNNQYSTHFYGSNTRIGHSRSVNETTGAVTYPLNQHYTSFVKSDFLQLNTSSIIKFEIKNLSNNNFTMRNFVSIGKKYSIVNGVIIDDDNGLNRHSYRSVILFQRIK